MIYINQAYQLIRKYMTRLVKYYRNTKNTEIIPLPYALVFTIICVIALVFFVKPAHVMSDELTQLDIEATAQQYSYPMNPFGIQDLSADMHNSEEWIPPVPVRSVEIKPTTTTTTTTTTTIALPEGTCSEWYPTAVEAGWPIDSLQKLGRIIWKESNCLHHVANKTYSYGLTQIEWSAHKNWLKTEFGITERDALYDPYTNLLVARWLYDYAEEHYGCGWQPWYMSGDWC